MKIIKSGESSRFEFQNEDITGFSMNAFGNHASAVARVADYSKIQVSAVLKQRGKEFTLFSTSLHVLVMESAFNNNAWLYALPAGVLNITLASTLYMQPGLINLGGIINLRGNDVLTLSVSVASDAFTASGWTNQFLQVDSINGVGLQFETPIITAISVMTSEAAFKQALGDNVTRVCLISNNVSEVIVKNLRVYSDRLNTNLDSTVLKLARLHSLQGVEIAEIAKRYSSFVLLDTEVDKCRIELDLDPTLVLVSQNYLVTRSYVADPETLALAMLRKSEHDASDRSKFGM